MKRALLALSLSGCTIIGASTGATTAEVSGHDGEVGKYALYGAAIGAALDLTVILVYLFVANSSQGLHYYRR